MKLQYGITLGLGLLFASGITYAQADAMGSAAFFVDHGNNDLLEIIPLTTSNPEHIRGVGHKMAQHIRGEGHKKAQQILIETDHLARSANKPIEDVVVMSIKKVDEDEPVLEVPMEMPGKFNDNKIDRPVINLDQGGEVLLPSVTLDNLAG